MIDLNNPADRAEFWDILATGGIMFLGAIALIVTFFCF